jgi:hypothetical protein
VGAERPVKCRRGGSREKGASRSMKKRALATLAALATKAMDYSQFVEPRCARNASDLGAREVLSPRAHGVEGQVAAARSFYAIGQPRKLRPNPSLERRATGKAPGPRGAVVYPAPRGPGALPVPPAQLKR